MDLAQAYYNLARLGSLGGDVERAFDHLRRAAQLPGFARAEAWKEPDFEPLRADPRFVEIVGPPPA